jgi:hypothetical protein
MQATGKQPGLSKLRITYLFVAITAVVGIGSFGYYIYRNYRDARLNLPQAQVERLIKDLRLYQSQTRPKSTSASGTPRLRRTMAATTGGRGRRTITTATRRSMTRPAPYGLCRLGRSATTPLRSSSSSLQVGCARGRGKRWLMRRSPSSPRFLPLTRWPTSGCKKCPLMS